MSRLQVRGRRRLSEAGLLRAREKGNERKLVWQAYIPPQWMAAKPWAKLSMMLPTLVTWGRYPASMTA